MAKNQKGFRTVRGYQMLRQAGQKSLTPSMEDYLEMIYRMVQKAGHARVNSLADMLNVQAPSVTRVIKKLADLGYVEYHRYGLIELSEKGQVVGGYLLERHKTVEQFLRNLGIAEDNLLVETELIEHQLSRGTFEVIRSLNQFFSEHPQVLQSFIDYQKENLIRE